MNRDDILKKAQAGKDGMDEREQQVLGLSFGVGGILMALLCVALTTRRRGSALAAAAFGLVCAGNLAVFLLG